MRLTLWWLLLLAPAALCFQGSLDAEGYLSGSTAWAIASGESPWLIQSLGYPRPAPKMRKTWSFSVSGPPGSRPGVKLHCSRLRFSPTLNCRHSSLSIVDGSGVDQSFERHCSNGQYDFISRHSSVDITLTAERPNELVASCTAQGILTDGNGHEVAGPPAPRPTPPSLVLPDSDEDDDDDSVEAGVTPGRRKTTCRCGYNKKIEGKIVTGSLADINEFPFMALLVTNRPKMTPSPFCGGTIVTARHVVTAAHCTHNKTLLGTPMAVVVGANKLWQFLHQDPKGAELIGVQRTFVHESYNNKTLQYDISLLYLEKDIVFTNNVGPACMATEQLNLVGQRVQAMGWGAEVHNGSMTQNLKKTMLDVVSLRTCYRHSRTSINLQEPHQTCVFTPNTGVCMGDSGSPLAWLDPEINRYVVIGAASYVHYCGSATLPSCAADVTAFIAWINRKITITAPSLSTCTKI